MGDGDVDVNFIDAAVTGFEVVGDIDVDVIVDIDGKRSLAMLDDFEVVVAVVVVVDGEVWSCSYSSNKLSKFWAATTDRRRRVFTSWTILAGSWRMSEFWKVLSLRKHLAQAHKRTHFVSLASVWLTGGGWRDASTDAEKQAIVPEWLSKKLYEQNWKKISTIDELKDEKKLKRWLNILIHGEWSF